jgi:DNA-binding MarR family transcriptional regulator
MATASDLPVDRLAIGQLLTRLLNRFRQELLDGAAALGYDDLRPPHLQIFGNVGIDGVRLTDLAKRTQLSMATTSEFVTELEQLGYLERRADPVDSRAKLIFPTVRGRKALDDAGNRVALIEQQWAELIGAKKFDRACYALNQLIVTIDEASAQPAAR